ncbi:MAG: hypothetical protein M3384_04790 [Acidobacteriota bacterium]|nr:hypothetical protein [Acidobacteriota bacterium]
MKKRLFLLIFSALICFSFLTSAANAQKSKPAAAAQQKLNVVREGVGIEGVVVGKSTMDEVVKKFGKDYKWAAHKKYSFSMSYPNLGLTFYMCQSDKRKQIFDIEIKQPYRAKTSRGIILGKSTVADIYKIYGKSRRGDATSGEDLEFRGVSFFYNTIRGKKVVTVIDVVENSGIRQCTENKVQGK